MKEYISLIPNLSDYYGLHWEFCVFQCRYEKMSATRHYSISGSSTTSSTTSYQSTTSQEGSLTRSPNPLSSDYFNQMYGSSKKAQPSSISATPHHTNVWHYYTIPVLSLYHRRTLTPRSVFMPSSVTNLWHYITTPSRCMIYSVCILWHQSCKARKHVESPVRHMIFVIYFDLYPLYCSSVTRNFWFYDMQNV